MAGNGEKRSYLDEVTQYSPLINSTIYGGVAHTGDLINTIQSLYPEMLSMLLHVGKIYPTDDTDTISERSLGSTDQLVTWSYNSTSHLTTVLTPLSSFNKTIEHFKLYNDDYTAYIGSKKREVTPEGPDWVSYNTYGFNIDEARQQEQYDHTDAIDAANGLGSMATWITQYPSGEQILEVTEKFCLAWGENPQNGVDSVIVGEIYVGQYGGIDSECDSG